MKYLEHVEQTGFLPNYNIYEELELLNQLDFNKPSTRIIKTKKGKKAIAALKNIEENHNNSWYFEIKKIAIKFPNEIALFYRGNKITFRELIEHADEYAKSLAKIGIKANDEIPACLANTPEFVYFILAVNKLGAKINLFGSHYDKEFIKQILDDCTNKLFVATDDFYGQIEDIISKREYKNEVIFSLADSLLEDPTKSDEYEEDLASYYYFENKVDKYKKKNNNIMSKLEFVEFGKDYQEEIIDKGTLDSEFLITYTSGSTKIGFPKIIIHTNRSLIVSGFFHNPELSGNPEIKGLRGLAHIHTDSNTDVITCISDNLMQVWSVALEPDYGEYTFLDLLILNKPNYCNATTSHIIRAAKQYLIEKKYNDRSLGFLLALFAVGEGTTKGEEKFINTFLKLSKAGSDVKIMGISLPYTTLSIGGGDTEHGGIYYSLWKELYEKIYYFKLNGREYGMTPEPYVQISVFKENESGIYSECNYNQIGLIASNSATTTKGYKNNIEAIKNMIITDDNGREWISNNVYGYIDELGTVHVKDRYRNVINFKNGIQIPNYKILDVVVQDYENIMSCSVTKVNTTYGEIPVINIEFSPFRKQTDSEIIENLKQRLTYKLPIEVIANSVFRIFDYNNSFPLTGSGKRSIGSIENMGLKNTFRLINGKIESTEHIFELTKNDSKKLKLSR